MSYTSFRNQFSFQVIPESFQTIDVITFSITVLFLSVIDETMDITSRSYTGISFSSIRTDDRTN